MVKIKGRLGIIIMVVLLVSIGTLVPVSAACTSGQDRNDLPPLDFPDKGNPKLDSQLNQLVSAERRGEAVSFAQQSNIELVDGAIRVIIEYVPGQLEAATEAVSRADAELETSYANLLQAVVPIATLSTLTYAARNHFIRLPQYPLPEVTGGN